MCTFGETTVMFVGHYAVAYALKAKEPKASLGMLFIAVQFVDLLFFPFALMGIEHLNFVEGYTQVNNYQMEFPFTHGLAGSLVWALLAFVLYYFGLARKQDRRKGIAVVMALAVLSHWFVDLLVHTPDLPLWYGPPKVGLGLWQHKHLTFALEGLLLLAGWGYYMKRSQPKKRWGTFAAYALVFFLLLINYLNFYVLPQGEDLMGLTLSAVFTYLFFGLFAYGADRGSVAMGT